MKTKEKVQLQLQRQRDSIVIEKKGVCIRNVEKIQGTAKERAYPSPNHVRLKTRLRTDAKNENTQRLRLLKRSSQLKLERLPHLSRGGLLNRICCSSFIPVAYIQELEYARKSVTVGA